MDKKTIDEIERRGVIAVLEIDDVATAVPVAQALVRGGVTAIELALRTDAAEPSIKAIAENVPEMMIGIGTVIRSGQSKRVRDLGADFAVAPGFNPLIVREAEEVELPFAPGISTASELEGAVEAGCNVLKLFPAVPLGGVEYLKSMAGPYAYLGLRFIPLGGVSLANLRDWAREKSILAVGGTWIAKKNLIAEGRYDIIEENAREAMRIWNEERHK